MNTVRASSPRSIRLEGIRLLIVDDHDVYRRALQAALSSEPEIEVVGLAGSAEEAVILAEETLPDVVLMDVRMPGASGIEAARRINDILPDANIVMLTSSDEEEDLFESIKAGATGYVLKDVGLDELVDVIRLVLDGNAFVTPSMASKLIQEFAEVSKAPIPQPSLTNREQKVLELISEGKTNRQIASQLYMSPHTVKDDVRNIVKKLHVRTRVEAVVEAMKEGLIAEHSPRQPERTNRA